MDQNSATPTLTDIRASPRAPMSLSSPRSTNKVLGSQKRDSITATNIITPRYGEHLGFNLSDTRRDSKQSTNLGT